MIRVVHYVGFRDDRYWSAFKVFGGPRVFHRWWDRRAAREIAPIDIVVFADGEWTQEPRKFNAPDITEEEEHEMETFADTVGPRLVAVKDKLTAKGWECPSIEVGAKVLGKHGLTIWAVGYLAGSDSPLQLPLMFGATMEAVLEALDKAADEAPTYAEEKAKFADAIAKLSPEQQRMIRFQNLGLERTFAR